MAITVLFFLSLYFFKLVIPYQWRSVFLFHFCLSLCTNINEWLIYSCSYSYNDWVMVFVLCIGDLEIVNTQILLWDDCFKVPEVSLTYSDHIFIFLIHLSSLLFDLKLLRPFLLKYIVGNVYIRWILIVLMVKSLWL